MARHDENPFCGVVVPAEFPSSLLHFWKWERFVFAESLRVIWPAHEIDSLQ
jgi:hypothetical protein